jgi:hypothetical protein
MRKLTRRQALVEALVAAGGTAGAVTLAGCGASGGAKPAATGSTLESTWADPLGVGVLSVGPGERLIARQELGREASGGAVIATLAHVTDAHVLDASSPARVTFLNRLGPPFQSTFRPQETLTAQVVSGAARAVRALGPDAVIQGGDLIDNAQSNELAHALAALRGGVVSPGSGRYGYYGVQLASDPDPFYYRPDLDAPRHPGLLERAVREFRSDGLPGAVHPVLGDHDILVAGEVPPVLETQTLATGNEAVWELPPGLTSTPGLPSLTTTGSPDGPPIPGAVSQLLAQALAGPKVRVPADASRRELTVQEAVDRLAAAGAGVGGGEPGTLDYAVDIAPQLRLIVLDLARRDGGSGGLVRPDQPGWLASQLAGAGERWVIVVSHQPLTSSDGGEELIALLDGDRRVIAALSGHIHRNLIEPRVTENGGYWLISTASLIDYPQQARALRIINTNNGAVAIQTWMLDHVFPGDLGAISRELAYLDVQGGRPHGFAGGRLDRNVTLYRAG